jgi:antirestriction protein ArdC
LVAELGAAYLCGSCGIAPQTLDNFAAYLASWLARLHNDKTLLWHAASHAQRAVDFILKAASGESRVEDAVATP